MAEMLASLSLIMDWLVNKSLLKEHDNRIHPRDQIGTLEFTKCLTNLAPN